MKHHFTLRELELLHRALTCYHEHSTGAEEEERKRVTTLRIRVYRMIEIEEENLPPVAI